MFKIVGLLHAFATEYLSDSCFFVLHVIVHSKLRRRIISTTILDFTRIHVRITSRLKLGHKASKYWRKKVEKKAASGGKVIAVEDGSSNEGYSKPAQDRGQANIIGKDIVKNKEDMDQPSMKVLEACQATLMSRMEQHTRSH